ncbi:MAG TPA: FliA/WhiG family RNA polymerase sigma factor [Gaiellaceae bacterium]|nr:FliA/WhiG family RNA polymerase sigma factor [Gaiellaceae bacterium]
MTAPTAGRLTAQEAESLWRSWKTRGDKAARDRLIMAYAPMVKYLASRKVRELPTHCELDDLVSCGLVAVVEAVDRFDPAKGATFEQYAWLRVSGAIVDELRRLDRVSRSSRGLARSIERVNDAWLSRDGRQPSEQELADELDVEVSHLRATVSELDRARVLSLSSPANQGEERETELGETIAAPADTDPQRLLLTNERSAQFRAAMATLSERERQVIGLIHVRNLQGAEVGRMLGVTESRVSQILASARRKLYVALKSYDELEQVAV